MTVIVTGAAGFVGMHVAERLLARGEAVTGVDTLNAYYDPRLKADRLARLHANPGFSFAHLDVADAPAMATLVAAADVTAVVHLAAQAGVRHSITAPFDYEHANLKGHLSVLEACRHAPAAPQLVYASSSSVYGERPLGETGFHETEAAEAPASLYAATKRAGELMSATYAGLYGMRVSGLRFFTVYGPWGRPDMAYWGFTDAITHGRPIEVFGEGEMARDFTFIDDIADGVLGVLDRPPRRAEHRLFNIGAGRPVGLMDMISTLERALGREAVKVMRPMQPGDVRSTFADISRLRALTGYVPRVRLEEGLGRFVAWWRERYG